MKRTLTIIFFVAFIVDVLGTYFDSPSKWVTKSLIAVVLLILYVVCSKVKSPKMMLALVTALLADMFMLLPDGAGFNLGMGVYLMTHLILASLFNDTRHKSQSSTKLIGVAAVIVSGVLAAFFILPNTAGNVQIGSGLYIVAACLMTIFAILRMDKIPGYPLVVLGSILFMLSSLIIGVDRFVTEIPYGDVFSAIAYGLGLYLIVEGYIMGDKAIAEL